MDPHPLDYKTPPPPPTKRNRWRVLGWTVVAIFFAMLGLVLLFLAYLYVGWHFGWIEPP